MPRWKKYNKKCHFGSMEHFDFLNVCPCSSRGFFTFLVGVAHGAVCGSHAVLLAAKSFFCNAFSALSGQRIERTCCSPLLSLLLWRWLYPTTHCGCFMEFLSKMYLRQISFLGTNEWKIRKNKDTDFISTFKIYIRKWVSSTLFAVHFHQLVQF